MTDTPSPVRSSGPEFRIHDGFVVVITSDATIYMTDAEMGELLRLWVTRK